jgi:LytS/YehU family sensor histidine kinase
LLDGYYDKWIVTKDGSVTYPRLPPGEYTFKVEGSMYPDFENASEATYSFIIHKPIWKENWFLTIAALSGILLVYLVIKQREKNLENIALLKHERIMFEFEHLKSQVNPHFLFNSLNTLTNLIAKDQKKAIDYTEHLSSLYQSILAHYENDLVLLSEEIAILENYFSIQQGRFGNALQLKTDIPQEVMRNKKIVPLALQILIENVIKHNVISGKEPLIISISANENEITISNFVYPKMSKEKGEGVGLINIKRRYELLTKRPVTYGLRKNEFIVILPLL